MVGLKRDNTVKYILISKYEHVVSKKIGFFHVDIVEDVQKQLVNSSIYLSIYLSLQGYIYNRACELDEERSFAVNFYEQYSLWACKKLLWKRQ